MSEPALKCENNAIFEQNNETVLIEHNCSILRLSFLLHYNFLTTGKLTVQRALNSDYQSKWQPQLLMHYKNMFKTVVNYRP